MAAVMHASFVSYLQNCDAGFYYVFNHAYLHKSTPVSLIFTKSKGHELWYASNMHSSFFINVLLFISHYANKRATSMLEEQRSTSLV